MAYDPTVWVDGVTAANAARLNKIEQGIADAYDLIVTGYRPPMIVVAASNSDATVRASADYVCAASGAQATINVALNKAAALVANYSGTPAGAVQRAEVYLAGGDYSCNSAINVPTGVTLRGSWLSHILANGCNSAGLIRVLTANTHACNVRDLWLDGGSSSGGSCNAIDFDMSTSSDTGFYPGINPDSDHHIDNMLITNFSGGTRKGIYVHADSTAKCRGNIISNNQIRDCGGNGIEVSSASDGFIYGNHVGGSDGVNIRINTGNTKVWGNKSFFSLGWGFEFLSGRHSVSNNESQDDVKGYYLGSSDAVFGQLICDGARDIGIQIATSGTQLNGFQIFNRGAQWPTTAVGLQIDASKTDLGIYGRINPTGITTKVSGTPGARSHYGYTDGTTVFKTP
jgi:parallel beta-helix repeat protein